MLIDLDVIIISYLKDFDLQSFRIIYDTYFALCINHISGVQIKICFLDSTYHLWIEKNTR